MTRRTVCVLALVALVTAAPALAQPAPQLVTRMKAGGLVLVMRHAHAPREVPGAATADPGNPTLERQLDAQGKADAGAVGRGLRVLAVPLSRVLVSPAFRARQTAQHAGFATAVEAVELGDNAASMAGVTEAQGRWLRQMASQVPGPGTLLLITHTPNLTRAFPEWGEAMAEGEVAVLQPSADGPVVLGRVRPGGW